MMMKMIMFRSPPWRPPRGPPEASNPPHGAPKTTKIASRALLNRSWSFQDAPRARPEPVCYMFVLKNAHGNVTPIIDSVMIPLRPAEFGSQKLPGGGVEGGGKPLILRNILTSNTPWARGPANTYE